MHNTTCMPLTCPSQVKTLALIEAPSQTTLGIIQWRAEVVKMRLESRFDARRPRRCLRSGAHIVSCSGSLDQHADSHDIGQRRLVTACYVWVTGRQERVFEALQSALQLGVETSQSLEVHWNVPQLWIDNLPNTHHNGASVYQTTQADTRKPSFKVIPTTLTQRTWQTID